MKYPFTVYFTQVEDHSFWIAECKSLKGCVGQGETAEEAIEELKINQNEWLETAKEFNIPIPEVPVEIENEYSGKFTVRVSPHVHRQAVELSKQQGISLNQYINDAIVSQNATLSTTGYIIPKVKEAINKLSMVMETSLTSNTRQHYSATNPYDFKQSNVLKFVANS